MSASLLHLALAGASGLALGAVGAVSYTRSKEATTRSSGGNSPAQGPPLGTTPPTLDQRSHAAHPQEVFSGTLAPSEVRNRVIQGGSIGESSSLGLHGGLEGVESGADEVALARDGYPPLAVLFRADLDVNSC